MAGNRESRRGSHLSPGTFKQCTTKWLRRRANIRGSNAHAFSPSPKLLRSWRRPRRTSEGFWLGSASTERRSAPSGPFTQQTWRRSSARAAHQGGRRRSGSRRPTASRSLRSRASADGLEPSGCYAIDLAGPAKS